MFNKLRNRTGKQFVKTYSDGGPVKPGQIVGEISIGSDGKIYKWNGRYWYTYNTEDAMASGDSFQQNPFQSTSLPGVNTPQNNTPQESSPFNVGTGALDTPTVQQPSILSTPTLNMSMQKSQVTGQYMTAAASQPKKETAQEMMDRITAESDADEEAYWDNTLQNMDTSVNAVEKTIQDTELKQARAQAEKDAQAIATGQPLSGDNAGAAGGAGEAGAGATAGAGGGGGNFASGFGGKMNGTLGSAIGNFASGNWKSGLGDMAVGAMKAVDNMLMGDKNFGAQSEAIDTAVHGVSSALMSSGNPYAMAAGAALEGANFLTKATGQTVQGFDVDINSSGYGQMGHMSSSSSRDFLGMIGLGGIFNKGKMDRKLAKRNEQMQMAMQAANVANEQKFEQEARANSIQNTVTNNQIALAGGIDTSLLGG